MSLFQVKTLENTNYSFDLGHFVSLLRKDRNIILLFKDLHQFLIQPIRFYYQL